MSKASKLEEASADEAVEDAKQQLRGLLGLLHATPLPSVSSVTVHPAQLIERPAQLTERPAQPFVVARSGARAPRSG
eukprot:COSAG01_NODE_1041_length_11959_cov_2.673356_4_plen_77_part_00